MTIIMNALFVIGNSWAADDDVLEKLALIFIDIADKYYEQVGEFISKIAEFSFFLVKTY
jgi:hypothetical protein